MNTSEVDLTPLLRNLAKHITLTADETAWFLTQLKVKRYRKGHFLLEAGEVSKHQLYVLEGCLRNYHIGEDGKEHILQFAPEDWWTGDMASMLRNQPALMTIDALEDSAVVLIEKAAYESLFERVPKFEHFFRILIQNAFIAQQRRMLSNLSRTAEERYAEFRKLYPSLDERVPQKHIASYLGMTPEFLSTVRKRVLSKEK